MLATESAVIKVDPDWKTNIAFGSPPPSRVSVVVIPKLVWAYTPGLSVWLPSSTPGSGFVVGSVLNVVYAAASEVWAFCAAVSLRWTAPPVIVTVPAPVNEAAGAIPTSFPAVPLIDVVPVFVMLGVLARTAKLTALPK